MARKFESCNYVAMHFIWAVGQSQSSYPRPQRRQRKIVADTAAAMHLDSPIKDS